MEVRTIVDGIVGVKNPAYVDFGGVTEGDDDVGFIGRRDQTGRSRDKGVGGRRDRGRHTFE
eukprot:scaffold44072_cov90-Cyclotella_meneghiniana.AAC.1